MKIHLREMYIVDNKILQQSLFLLLSLTITKSFAGEGYCSKAYGCSEDSFFKKETKYILYDVNVGEGFNLKRDVYMRMAMFMRAFADKSDKDWHLVLPPWTKQWHWTSEKINISYLWHNFFEIESLQLYSPVIEIDQFFIDYGKPVDEVYILQHFPEFYEWKGEGSMDWSDRWRYAECRDHPYWKHDNETFVFFRGKRKVKAKKVTCISFQGTSAFLESVLSSTDSPCIMFDRAEIATHMMYGDIDYWMCRRSMRFAKHLVRAAASFRTSYLSSTDEKDGSIRPLDWREERSRRSAKGGPYLGVHLRRKDFIYGRPKEIPSIDESAIQIKNYLEKLNLTTVFVATDMVIEEYQYLEQMLAKEGLRSVKFEATEDEKNKFKEGGLAIIDQIIASHARFFIGTHESTFTFRIQEEREIMGFPADSTFNRFCPKSNNKNCTPPTRWLIKYPDKVSWQSPTNNNFEHFNMEEL